MSDIDAQVAQLKERANSATRARMLAEVNHQRAKQEVEEASQLLREKFGVTSLEEAKALMQNLRFDLDEKINRVSEMMDNFERQK